MNLLGRSPLRAGVRRQATAVATAVVGAALLVGGLVLVLLLQRSVTSTLEANLSARATQEATAVSEDGTSGLASNEGYTDGVLLQVVDASGKVVYTSQPSKSVAAATLWPDPGETLTSGRTLLPRFGSQSVPLVVGRGVEHGGQRFVVLASASQEAQGEAVATAGLLLLSGIPILTLLTGLVTWRLVGRALRSVEIIRAHVEHISASRLDERVPVPATRDEIAHLAVTMNDMLRRLEAAQATQRRFVADASHELRSPLATLAASVEVGESDPSGRTWQELSPILQAETARMEHLVEDLLLLSKVDDHALRLARVEVDLDDIVDREVRRLRGITQTQLTMRAAPARVLGDEHKLAQVVRNLADNAVRAARSQVRLSVGRQGPDAVLRVEDDGPGIPVADRERVLDRFVRLDESRSRASGGSGLGLSITREIVLAHGGSLSIGDSALGGAAVEVRIPLRDDSPTDEEVDVAARRL